MVTKPESRPCPIFLRPSLSSLMYFTRPVFLVRANLVFIGIRYEHLEYNASKASPFYTTVLTMSGLCIPE